MKVVISFNLIDLEKALEVASPIEAHADLFSLGPLLLYKYGIKAVERFHEAFPRMSLLVESQILVRPQQAVKLFSDAGADWISVMAGAGSRVIHTACSTAQDAGRKIILDLADANSVGQSALEAQGLGVKALSFHKSTIDDEGVSFHDRWDMIKGNTQLPIFVSAHISRENVGEVLGLNPSGIIIGSSVITTDDPQKEAEYFAELAKR
jgi:3-keto-L-gulonate-6-phosphate decarboxylase